MKMNITPETRLIKGISGILMIMLMLTSSSYAETLILQPGTEGKDSYTCDCAPNTNNPYGPITMLYQGRIGPCINTALSQWDLSAVPANVIITSAVVEFKCYQLEGSPSGEMLYSRIIEDWGETTVTHNTLPDYSEQGQVVTGWPSNGQWHVVNITELVCGWYNGSFPNYGIIMHSRNTTATCDANLYSSDNGIPENRPKMTITYEHQNPLTVTLTPLNPPIQIPANGGSFNFNTAVVNQGSSQQPFSVWARIKYPDGSYTTPTLGPVIINPPLNVTVSRLRSQNVPSNYPAGEYLYLGYANPVFSYPAIDSASFTFTKSNTSDGGPLISEATCGGDLFPGEGSISSQPSDFNLWGANPNPFNPKTVLSFELRAGSRVSLEVYDNAGRLIVKLVDGWRDEGSHQATFDGSNLASGIYLYCLTAGLEHATGKMVLMK